MKPSIVYWEFAANSRNIGEATRKLGILWTGFNANLQPMYELGWFASLGSKTA
jgi:hypothetical protein